MSGNCLRSQPTRSAPNMFDQLTTLELLALSAKLRRGRHRARLTAIRSRSPLQAWDMVRLTNHLAGLENGVIQTLDRR